MTALFISAVLDENIFKMGSDSSFILMNESREDELQTEVPREKHIAFLVEVKN